MVITGDFNTEEISYTYSYMANPVNGFIDTKYQTADSSKKATFAGYGNNFNGEKYSFIDHIFALADLTGTFKFEVFQNKYISDHSAIMSTLHLGKKEEGIAGLSYKYEFKGRTDKASWEQNR